MKTEVSAGGVVVKKIKGKFHLLLIKDRHGDWMFPKGWIESGETLDDAAIREIREESGQSHLHEVATLSPVHYSLRRGDVQVDKTIHFFLFEEVDDEALIPQVEEGITQAQWFPLNETSEMIAYPDSYQPVIQEAILYLEIHPL